MYQKKIVHPVYKDKKLPLNTNFSSPVVSNTYQHIFQKISKSNKIIKSKNTPFSRCHRRFPKVPGIPQGAVLRPLLFILYKYSTISHLMLMLGQLRPNVA